jgi:hypothetical protein
MDGYNISHRRPSRSFQFKNNNNSSSNSSPGTFSAIFVHIHLCELLFYEHHIYCIHAECYTFLRPGKMLSSFFSCGQHARDQLLTNPFIAPPPWNQLPLLTYTAVLALSGMGTGNVEDMIAVRAPDLSA